MDKLQEYKAITLDTPGVLVVFKAEFEEEGPWGSFATGDDEEDKRICQKILDDYNNGNEYAWFIAHVSVAWEGFCGDDYLGGCNYKDRQQFLDSPEYTERVNNALEDLNSQVQRSYNVISKYYRMREGA